MSRYFYVNDDDDDDEVEGEDYAIFNTYTFRSIFNRVAYHFKHFEITEKKECFFEYGLQGIDLSNISKDSFNIFYLRCKEALNNYPDIREKTLHIDDPQEFALHVQYITSEFLNVLSMLEKDKRYDPEWIKEYEINSIMQDCMEPYQPKE